MAQENPCHYDESASGRLYFYRARYLDPELSRFVSEDPLGFGGGDVNLAAYVYGDPVSLTDPTGEFGIGGAVFGFGVGVVVQLAQNGGRFECIDWVDVGISALVGAFAPGALATLKNVNKSTNAISAINGQLSTAKSAARIAKLQGRASAQRTNIGNALLVQGGYQGAKWVSQKVTPSTATCGCPQ